MKKTNIGYVLIMIYDQETYFNLIYLILNIIALSIGFD